jgi:hypothetical protein
VWVFVDYNNCGTMTRLPLSGATLTAPSWVGATITVPNEKGAWVVGNAKTAPSGSFSATVKLFTDTPDLNGACAYAINYPSVGKYTTASTITFTGTPPFYLTFNSGSTVVLREAAPHTYTYTIPSDKTLSSFTDASGAPGTFTCVNPATPAITRVSAATVCQNTNVVFRITEPAAGVS